MEGEGRLYRIHPPLGGAGTRRFDIAYSTLARASVFLGALDCEPSETPDPRRETVRARFLGNCLRELDRFLNLMLNESAALAGQAGASHGAFVHRHNAANKLSAVRALRSLGCPEHGRLMAIGRVRECLASCAGQVHAQQLWSDLAEARSGERPPTLAESEQARLVLRAADLHPICAFYGGLADALADEVSRRPAPPAVRAAAAGSAASPLALPGA